MQTSMMYHMKGVKSTLHRGGEGENARRVKFSNTCLGCRFESFHCLHALHYSGLNAYRPMNMQKHHDIKKRKIYAIFTYCDTKYSLAAREFLAVMRSRYLFANPRGIFACGVAARENSS